MYFVEMEPLTVFQTHFPTSPPSRALFLPAVAESENALAGNLFLADRERLGTVLQRGRRRWGRAEWDTSCSRVGRRKPIPGANSGLQAAYGILSRYFSLHILVVIRSACSFHTV